MKRQALFNISVFGMIITGLFPPVTLQAQAPQAVAYQAIVRNLDGNVLADQQVALQVTIHADAAEGVEVYCETHTATTSPMGLVTLEIGNGSLSFGSFEAIDWSTGVYFLEVEMDPWGGSNYVQMGTTQLLSVPYALYSERTGQTYMAGNGIDITEEVISNTAPDQEVIISEGGGVSVTGGYPNYTLTNAAPDMEVILNGGDGIGTSGTYPNYTIANTAPNAYHTGDATGGDVISVVGLQGYPVTATSPAMNQVLQWDGSQWYPTTLEGVSPGWSLTGNSGTDPEVNFLGTTDNLPLRFKVDNQPAGEINPINDNTFLGKQAGNNSTGPFNIAIGRDALYSNFANSRSTAIGLRTLQWADPTTEGRETFNTAVGYEALRGIELTAITGRYHTAIGDQALCSNSSGNHNTAIGVQALYSNTSGHHNTAVGKNALHSNTEGHSNTAVGRSALIQNLGGDNNTAMGYGALSNNTDGSYNTAVGQGALYGNSDGNGNTAIGADAFCGISSFHNTAVGYSAGGEDNEYTHGTFLGAFARPDDEGYTNCMALGEDSRRICGRMSLALSLSNSSAQ